MLILKNYTRQNTTLIGVRGVHINFLKLLCIHVHVQCISVH